MKKKYLAKIIATNNEGLRIISACINGAKVKVSDIKYLATSKVFLLSIERTKNEADQENQKNQIKFYPIKNKYILKGPSFNANNLVDDLLFKDQNSNFFNIDTRIEVSIDKIFLDNEYDLFNFNGNIIFKNKEIVKANLNGSFPNNKKLNFTIN